jgi:hypothetical protein
VEATYHSFLIVGFWHTVEFQPTGAPEVIAPNNKERAATIKLQPVMLGSDVALV